MARIFLIVAGLMWLAYGIYMLLAPGALATTAGVGALNTTGTIELRAIGIRTESYTYTTHTI